MELGAVVCTPSSPQVRGVARYDDGLPRPAKKGIQNRAAGDPRAPWGRSRCSRGPSWWRCRGVAFSAAGFPRARSTPARSICPDRACWSRHPLGERARRRPCESGTAWRFRGRRGGHHGAPQHHPPPHSAAGAPRPLRARTGPQSDGRPAGRQPQVPWTTVARKAFKPGRPVPDRPPVTSGRPALLSSRAMGSMDGKVAVIFGVANKRSIAWGIAQALADGREPSWRSTIRTIG